MSKTRSYVVLSKSFKNNDTNFEVTTRHSNFYGLRAIFTSNFEKMIKSQSQSFDFGKCSARKLSSLGHLFKE